MCFPKTGIVTSRLDPHSIIGVKIPDELPHVSQADPKMMPKREGRRFLGEAIAAETVPDFQSCQSTCKGNMRCVAFTFYRTISAQNCKMFNNPQEAHVPDPSADSGWKEQPP
jgi:hypothetical protein